MIRLSASPFQRRRDDPESIDIQSAGW